MFAKLIVEQIDSQLEGIKPQSHTLVFNISKAQLQQQSELDFDNMLLEPVNLPETENENSFIKLIKSLSKHILFYKIKKIKTLISDKKDVWII